MKTPTMPSLFMPTPHKELQYGFFFDIGKKTAAIVPKYANMNGDFTDLDNYY